MSIEKVLLEYPLLYEVLKKWRGDLLRDYSYHGNKDYVSILFCLGVVAGADLDRNTAKRLVDQYQENEGSATLSRILRDLSKMPFHPILRFAGELTNSWLTLRVVGAHSLESNMVIQMKREEGNEIMKDARSLGDDIPATEVKRLDLLRSSFIGLGNALSGLTKMGGRFDEDNPAFKQRYIQHFDND